MLTLKDHQISKTALWGGRIMSALAVCFLLFNAVLHLMGLPMVIDIFTQLGYNANVAFPLGIVEVICLLIYVIPSTSVFGAIVLTGYLGGAVATHVRVGDPLFSHVLAPVYVAILLWVGLWLRDDQLRALTPFRKR